MHRRRTALVDRTTRATERIGTGSKLVGVAKTVHFRGVITTYKVHDRLLSNRTSRRRFEDARPALDEVQLRVLEELDEQDYAVLPFDELVPDAELRSRVDQEAAAFVAETETQLAAAGGGVRDLYKDYLVRRYKRVSELGYDAPWLTACLSSHMLDLANAYLRMWSKLEYVDFWYSVPVKADSERIQSQRWHRDFDDRHLLKAFLYLVDVDENTGPFEFVAGSARGGTLAELYPWFPLSPAYPKQQEFDRVVPAEAMRTFTAPKGTLVLCNTSGFHRGGFATAKPRILATATYCSPASLKSLTERNYRLPRGDQSGLSAPQRYALR
jgi:ectoine hydroxylase-related dioxygenase (phytanoyl-CoA dioxygenase family)